MINPSLADDYIYRAKIRIDIILLSSLRKDAKWLRTQREIHFYSKEDADRAIATAQEFFSLLEGFP